MTTFIHFSARKTNPETFEILARTETGGVYRTFLRRPDRDLDMRYAQDRRTAWSQAALNFDAIGLNPCSSRPKYQARYLFNQHNNQ